MRTAVIATLLGAAACGLRNVQGPPGEEQVVVQGVLNTQGSEQVLWIERTIPAGDSISFAFRPLESPPTRVEVRDSSGAVFSYQPDAANAARYVASFAPVHGQRYELLVDVGSQVLRASTRVPAAVAIVDPAADTIVASRASPLGLTWVGPIRPIRVTVSDTTGRELVSFPEWVTHDTTLAVGVASSLSAIGIWVLALDTVTARVAELPFVIGLDPAGFRDFRGNVSGGVGFFGAASGDHVIVRLQ